MSTAVKIFEVGPRDGLQNEKRRISLATKKWFISSLIDAGVREMEIGSFVNEKKVPQMADTAPLYKTIRQKKIKLRGTRVWGLVPNMKGLERAISEGAKDIAVFTAATDAFNKKNIGRTVAESLKEVAEITRAARKKKINVRGYVSTAFGCPYEGKVTPKKALKVTEKLLDLGVEQVEISDTIGVATPGAVDRVIKPAIKNFGAKSVAVHFHDTRGTALANSLRSFEHGVRTIDGSAGGLGGCPFAPGATGNLATEDLVYMLHGLGVKTGINLAKLATLSLKLAEKMKRPVTSRFVRAFGSSNTKGSKSWL